MYIHKCNKVENEEILFEVIQRYGFATLIITQANQPHVVHLPLLLDPTSRTLKGHVARANPISSLDLTQPYHCMVIFQGPNAYISPSWYATKEETGRAVPTWNYIAIHVHGQVTLIRDADWLLSTVTLLSDKHEAPYSEWKVSDAPEAYVSALLRAITGIEISIDSIEGNFKLSDDKNNADFDGVVHALKQVNSDSFHQQTVHWMEKMRANTEN
jgi:transcriptional regulator